MTFGTLKSIIEKNLLESYNNEKDFKKSLREFKHNVLNNKSMSKAYTLYDQLSTPQGLTEQDAKEFLEEGISLLHKILPTIKLPKPLLESVKNNYENLDILLYSNKLDLLERVTVKKQIIKVLKENKQVVKESINIPIKSMVSIANRTLNEYIENLDENSKKGFFQLISEDSKTLETKFEVLRETTINKLKVILDKEPEFEIKTKISETIGRVENEKFDQMNFLKLKSLEESI
jgi:hypothetical protein